MNTAQDQLADLDYRNKIKAMPNRELLEYLAIEQYYIKINCSKICPDPDTGRQQKVYNYTGLSGFIVAVGMAVWALFKLIKGGG